MNETKIQPNNEGTLCPDCGVSPGEQHLDGCDVEPCPSCGGQLLSCNCQDVSARLPWTGEWPGIAECREFGWYDKLIAGQGWVSCSAEDDGARHDLNRLYRDARWDKDQARFVQV